MDVPEKAKTEMRDLPKSQKIILLQQHEIKENSLIECLEILKKPNLKNISELLEIMSRVDEGWIKNFFIEGGWQILIKTLEKRDTSKSGKDIAILGGMVEFLKFLLNDEAAVNKVKDFQFILMVIRMWDIKDIQIKKNIFDILEFVLDQNGCYE